MSSRDEGPVYYREIQKCAYLTRITTEVSASKLRPLGVKKVVNKPMWTQFCVHNGKTPYLEQYPEQDSSATHSHKPLWKVCLKTARHITASVKPHSGDQYDFLIDTENVSVRMLAQDWDSMQDWVTTLRNTLHELKIISRGENVYCGPPAPPPAPRAPARDPMSPLPPTPPVPPDRVPGIELTPNVRAFPAATQDTATRSQDPASRSQDSATRSQDPATRSQDPATRSQDPATRSQDPATQSLDPATRSQDPTTRSQDPATRSQDPATRPQDPATRSQDPATRPEASATRFQDPASRSHDPATRSQDAPFLPQNSIFRPQNSSTRLGDPTNIPTEEPVDISNWDTPFSSLPSTSQNRGEPSRGVTKICGQNICLDDSIFKRTSEGTSEFFADVDNNSEVDDVDIESESGYKQRLIVSEKSEANGETSVGNNQSSNITVIQVSNKDPPHTAIPVLGPETNVFDFEFKEKLTLQSDPNFVNIINTEQNSYGTTFNNDVESNFGKNDTNNEFNSQTALNQNKDENISNLYGHISLTTTVNLPGTNATEDVYERLCMASTSEAKSPLPVKRIKNADISRKSSLPNLDTNDSTYEYLFLSNNNVHSNEVNSNGNKVAIGLVNGHVNRINDLVNDSVNRVNQTNGSVNRVNINSDPLARANSLKNNANVSTSNHNLNRVRINAVNDPVNRVNDTESATTETVNTVNIANSPVNRVNATNGIVNRLNDPVNRVNTTNDSVSRIAPVERTRSQNTYDSSPRARDIAVRRVQNDSPKTDIKNDKTEPPKPKWKRGFTELSLLTRRAIGQVRRQDSPTRQDNIQNSPGQDATERCVPVTSPVSVVHRSRPEVRVDTSRRRSSSLSNGDAPLSPPPNLQPLRARQAAALRAEQRRGAALVAPVPTRQPPIFADYNKQVWVAWWGVAGARWMGRAGDRVCAVRGMAPRDAAHARQMVLTTHAPMVDILFHRVPLGNIYVINKREQETLGLKLDNECNITNVEGDKAAGRGGLPPPGKWALTEVNNRPLNLIKGGEDDMNRLSMHGAEVSLLIQPSPLVKKLRAALKGNKSLLGLR